MGIGAGIAASALIGGVSSLIGSRMNSRSVRDTNEKNAALQREFAKKGIQWKVEDAKEAGIHPLFALGANTTQAQPSYVSDSPGDAVASAGKQIGGAVEQLMFRNAEETLRGKNLDNQIKEQQWAQLKAQNLEANRRRNLHLYTYDPMYKDHPLNIYNPNNASGMPNVYQKANYNYDQAVDWLANGYFPYINPELNMETGEVPGTTVFFAPRPKGWALDAIR